MNLYLLLALAFGAFTGVADVRVPRAAVTVTESVRKRALRCGAAVLRGVSGARRGGPRRHTENVVVRVVRVLTGAISPRAPAVTC